MWRSFYDEFRIMQSKPYIVIAEALGQLEKDHNHAREDLLYVESQRQADDHVLTWSREDENALKVKNAQQAQEIEDLKARLTIAEAKDRKTDEAMSDKCAFLHFKTALKKGPVHSAMG